MCNVCYVIDRKPIQEDVFAKIGKGAVSNVLNGYNSTVFAYGQTGSGKTFTVTGGAERYGAKQRPSSSVIPRLFGLFTGQVEKGVRYTSLTKESRAQDMSIMVL